MATTTSPSLSLSLSPPTLPLFSIFKPNHISSSFSIACNSHLPRLPALSSKTHSFCPTPLSVVPFRAGQKWRISSFHRSLLLLEADPVENSQIVESVAPDDGVSSIISVLLFVAFVGLSILSIGVIYIALTDFLQKREREKFEKEEAAKKKSSKKGKVRARSRAGPRGFGQKIEDDDNDAD